MLSKHEIYKGELLRRPWINSYKNAKKRCENPNDPRYKDYGGRGIEFKLSHNDCKYLWERDKANLLSWVSIDRIDNDGNYELSNCQFIEMTINSGKDKTKQIQQFDLQHRFIKEWNSITDACKYFNIDNSNMTKVLNGKINSLKGYKWRYKND